MSGISLCIYCREIAASPVNRYQRLEDCDASLLTVSPTVTQPLKSWICNSCSPNRLSVSTECAQGMFCRKPPEIAEYANKEPIANHNSQTKLRAHCVVSLLRWSCACIVMHWVIYPRPAYNSIIDRQHVKSIWRFLRNRQRATLIQVRNTWKLASRENSTEGSPACWHLLSPASTEAAK